MIDHSHVLSLSRQAKALGISRGSVYYLAQLVSDADLAVMRRIDELHLNYPFAGSRMLQGFLVREGFEIGRLHVRTLMKRMRIEAIYRRPNTSKPAPGHKIYPYLLRNLIVDRPNQVWAMDITYIPMARGFVYLAAVVDWFSRKVLAWRLSHTMDAGFRVAALEEALARFGKPKILKTDQCSPFTSLAFTSVLREAEAVVRKLPDRLRLDLTSNNPTVRQSAEETVAMKIAAALGDAQSTFSEV
jgi:putative transposase